MSREEKLTTAQLEAERLVIEGQMRIAAERLNVLSTQHKFIILEQMRRMANEKLPQ